jgi:hypothetical protein
MHLRAPIEVQDRRGVRHLRVHGKKGSKIRYAPRIRPPPAQLRPT